MCFLWICRNVRVFECEIWFIELTSEFSSFVTNLSSYLPTV